MKKPCAGCGKQIPEAALHCVFCGAKQAASDAAEQPPSSLDEALRRAVEGADAAAAAISGAGEGAVVASPMLLDPTPVRGLPILLPPTDLPDAPVRSASPPGSLSPLVRLVMASGGLVLITLFALPWRGVSSWRLLETLVGADFVRQFFFLAGGAILLVTAVLPVPSAFRALVGALISALPLVLGAEGLIAGWRGWGAALAIIALPATHLMRTRQVGRLDRSARTLVVAAAIAVALMYLVPVSSVMPLLFVGRLLTSSSVAHTALGLFFSIPLVLAALSLLGALGRDLTSVEVLLAVLILLWAPAAVLIFIGDGTQLYLALAVLWTSVTAALCVAQLLTMAAASAAKRA